MPSEEKVHRYDCVHCGKAQVKGWGNNPFPLYQQGKVCDDCNQYVIQARIRQLLGGEVVFVDKK